MAITSILAGSREIIGEVASFAKRCKTAGLDGAFSAQEIKEYSNVLNFLKSKKLITPEQHSHYMEFLKSGCTGQTAKDPIFLALREELVGFIESEAYTSAPPKISDASAHLATDIQMRVRERRYRLEGSPNYSTDTAFEQVGAFSGSDEMARIALGIPTSCDTMLGFSEEEVLAQREEDSPAVIGGPMGRKETVGPYARRPDGLEIRTSSEVIQVDPRYR